jgi:hypothetical protein
MRRRPCSPAQNLACYRRSRGPATWTRDLWRQQERSRTWRLPCFFGLGCAARHPHRFDCAFFAHKSRLQPICRHRLLLLFKSHQFRRLGRRDCRFARALVVAHAPGDHWNGCLLIWRSVGRGHRAGALGRGSAGRVAPADETHVHSVLLGGSPLGRGRTAESDWSPTGVAIRLPGTAGAKSTKRTQADRRFGG